MDDQKQQLLLADNSGGLLQVLQRLLGVPEILKCAESSGIGNEPNNQTMAVQRVGNSLNWTDICIIKQGP